MRSLQHIVATLLLALTLPLGSSAQFVTLEGRRFMLDGQEFYPVVLNYGIEFVSDDYGNNQPEEIYYSPMHELDRIPQNHFECTGSASCDQQLREHFDKIVEMGFNTIRLVGAAPEAFRTSGGERLYKLKVRDIAPYGNHYHVGLSTAGTAFNDPMSDRYVYLVSNMLDAAEDAGLKVILLTGTDITTWPISEDELEYEQADAELYAQLLTALGEQLLNHPALLGYDVFNEPRWKERNPSFRMMSKSEVCEWTSMWYDALTTADPNHLVTIGGVGKHEINSWDPAVMKIDFYSPHPYLEEDWVFAGFYDVPAMIDMYMAELYWLAASTAMPWIIGETTFSANDGETDYNDDPNFTCLDGDAEHHQMPYMHGTEAMQAQFTADVMEAARAYRSSGFSWWYFQDGRSHSYQNAETPKQILSNYYGALGYGDGTNRWRDKPMVDVVQAYQPEPLPEELPEPPPDYWNWQALPSNVYRTYHLQDQNQEPIAHGIALVEWKYPHGPGPLQHYPLWVRTVSDESGTMELHQPNPIAGLGGPIPGEIQVDASGATRETSDPPWLTGHTIELERNLLTYARSIAGLSLINEQGSNHAAWAELTILDSEVSASGTEQAPIRFEARHWVHMTGEFHIDNTSEALIRTAKTFPDCSDPYLGMAPQQADARPLKKNKSKERDSDVQLSFHKQGAAFIVYPNPCVDRTTLVVERPGVLVVRDSRGLVLHQATCVAGKSTLDTTEWATGLYHLVLEHESGVHTIKLTKIN